MKEAYCSYKISKLLKEKGFDEPCISYFIDNVDYIDYFYSTEELTELDMGVWETLRPTLQMACAWLREKHLIHVYAEHKAFFQERPKKLYYHWIPFIKTLPFCPINKSGFQKDTIYLNEFCDSYEDAVEAACLYALKNLIK